jgi:hypothetical protein
MTYDFRSAAASEALWPAASKDLDKLQTLLAASLKRPTEANVRKVLNAAKKETAISVWSSKCLAPEEYTAFVEVSREVYRLAKDKQATVETTQAVLDRYFRVLKANLDGVAPASFMYSGFKISNEERVSDKLCRQVLDGLDFLRALFKKRGVVKFIDQEIARVVLVPDSNIGVAYFHAGTHELVVVIKHILKSTPARMLDSYVNETLLHEFGHYIHRVYIKGEAEAAWNAPWREIPSLANPYDVQLTEEKRKQKLDPLEIVTEYGKTDKYEDFAETFVAFIAAPEKLSPTAKFRMQRALSLSGLYGKPVMRLAHAVLVRYLVEAWATPRAAHAHRLS